MLIGITGYARSGKDSVAKVLVENYGFKRIAFADKLRQVLYVLDPIVNPAKSGYFANPKHVMSVQDVIDQYGWDGYKETPYGEEVRRLLQRLGSEVGRDIFGNNFWVDIALKDIDESARICLTDCRFRNEAAAIRSRGGKIVRVSRKGVGPANDHISEHDLDDFDSDFYLSNDGSLLDLRENVVRFANEIKL